MSRKFVRQKNGKRKLNCECTIVGRIEWMSIVEWINSIRCSFPMQSQPTTKLYASFGCRVRKKPLFDVSIVCVFARKCYRTEWATIIVCVCVCSKRIYSKVECEMILYIPTLMSHDGDAQENKQEKEGRKDRETATRCWWSRRNSMCNICI